MSKQLENPKKLEISISLQSSISNEMIFDKSLALAPINYEDIEKENKCNYPSHCTKYSSNIFIISNATDSSIDSYIYY